MANFFKKHKFRIGVNKCFDSSYLDSRTMEAFQPCKLCDDEPSR